MSFSYGVGAVGSESLPQWAYISLEEVNVALAASILRYEYAFEVFKRQTSAFLGTVSDRL